MAWTPDDPWNDSGISLRIVCAKELLYGEGKERRLTLKAAFKNERCRLDVCLISRCFRSLFGLPHYLISSLLLSSVVISHFGDFSDVSLTFSHVSCTWLSKQLHPYVLSIIKFNIVHIFRIFFIIVNLFCILHVYISYIRKTLASLPGFTY